MSMTDERYRRITAGVPRLDDDRLREVLRVCFGVSAVDTRPLAGETDQNVWVADASGAEYVFKVCSAGDLGAVRFQNALLRHLAEHAPDLPVPRVVAARTGVATTPSGDVIPVPGEPDLVARLLTWLPGTPLAEVGARSAELLADVGEVAGRLAAATVSWQHPEPPAPHYWEFPHAATVLAEALPAVADPDLHAAISRVEAEFVPLLDRLPELPQGVVHHDLNAFNLLVGPGPRRRVIGVIDFGDAQRTARVADLAILCASAMRGVPDPLHVAAALVAAYHRVCPLTDAEVDLLYPLLAIRAATVAATAARLDAAREHGDPRHRSPAAAELVRVLAETPAEFGVATLRHACGLPAQTRQAVVDRLAGRAVEPLVAGDLRPVDLTVSSAVFDDVDPRDQDAVRTASAAAIRAARPAVAVGRYGEPRFTSGGGTVSVGLDLFAEAGAPVSAPLAGSVGHGPPGVDLLLRHETAEDIRFWTIYTGLSTEVSFGDEVAAGQNIGAVGPNARLLVQVSTVPVTGWREVPAEVPHADAPVWQALLPDPTPLLGSRHAVTAWQSSTEQTLAARRKHLSHTHPTYFSAPITMVRARDCRFYDENGRGYLDALNNVTLLGHGHPRLVDAATRQLRRLNTNSRFVYEVLTEYAEALTATLPDGLDVVYFLNSGSEANDLALRMARYLTGRDDVVIIDDAYHGYTTTVADVSPSRYKHYGKPDTTHPTPVPDRYRGGYGYDDPEAGAKYARHVTDTFERLAGAGRPPAAFLYEGLLAGGGQIVLPPGYLAPIHAEARRHGAFTIADEVQVGFGRLGEAFWGFQTQGVVPDFVTMGKAMGNGFPVSALVTTREISEAFDRTGRFFSTYGGNPVACAVGLELLRVLDEERLQDNASTVGRYLRDRLGELADRHELIGDVRGQGFYSGVEFVLDRATKEPAAAETLIICERLKEEGVLVYPTGPAWNILKLKPPLTFTRAHADELVSALDRVLEAGW
ncbi:4-aminobutyrate aminotransferase-like enzyme/Ser/Thr protein kinase RdoA (MazF antagonist) [Saccharothrix tamanrassetensis]|uniref:4-aminobutyrate aminotransferase-like enzyme/Ser/Thr protein kinase RdoA (MazF antagonist) n=1 Tax=Saccharothrix tamanrassetensis TaxID=1051531 RepID=A0A841CEL0_9PSEU|nr:aminotransferase class III-fold pyridoxal phosphate-dependent enzyme [Saccharothrix tamanrassetensis]MBB5956992.1 4-aminobutyrate aminotransferase-like enzyme/Ser/Thr protein kinase RdoA (MazF antagonist) [Saccharothrix tamanrassetensis]